MRQHYVSQGYLEGFTDPSAGQHPGVWTVDGVSGEIKPLRPEQVAAIVDYYTVTIDGERDNFVETHLSELESATTPILAMLRDHQFISDDRQRSVLSEFMAMQVVRVPAFRDAVSGFYVNVTRKLSALVTHTRDMYARALQDAFPERTFTEEQIDRAWAFAKEPKNYNIKMTPETSLAHALHTVDTVADIIFSMQWSFLVAGPPAAFITTDNPVGWANPDFPNSFYGPPVPIIGETTCPWRLGLVGK